MTRSVSVLVAGALTTLALLVGCGSSQSGDNANTRLEAIVSQGVVQIQGSKDLEKLRAELFRTLARLRTVHGTTPAARRSRALAILGFQATLRGIESRLAFTRNDSGNVEAATRDAILADRTLKKGASLLRAAGRALGVRVRTLNGY